MERIDRTSHLLLLAAVFLFALGRLVPMLLGAIPFPAVDDYLNRQYSTVLLDAGGREIYVYPLDTGIRRIYIPASGIPRVVKSVFIAAEDSRFFMHGGFDPAAIARAFFQNLINRTVVSGASTISMQLARMVEKHSGGYIGKLKEAFNALRIEARLSKQRILELWLSNLPFGGTIEGLEAASRDIFGISVDQLSASQAAILAIIPRSPSLYHPSSNPIKNAEAAQRILRLTGRKTDIEALTDMVPGRGIVDAWPNIAPHFAQFVKQRLVESDRHGVPVVSTLDLDIQHTFETLLQVKVDSARENRITNCAGLVVDNGSASIRAYVGSRDFYNDQISGQIDGVQILRQPGSTLKPFLYAFALENGYTASSILPDIPLEFGSDEVYIPMNFSDNYRGPVRLRVALASSLNIPAVYLVHQLGIGPFADTLESAGLESVSHDRSRLGLGIALGNAEVSVYEMVRGFRVFATDGTFRNLRWRDVEARAGAAPADGSKVFEIETVGIIRNILSDPVHRITGFGRDSVLNTPFDAILKTGTSNQFNNIWALGSTPGLTAGVWMGNFSGETVIGKPGSSLPAEVVVELLRAHGGTESFEQIDTLTNSEICSLSGKRATAHCPSTLNELFVPGSVPDECDYHGERASLPSLYKWWAEAHGYETEFIDEENTPYILSPSDGAVFYVDPRIPEDAQEIQLIVAGTGPFAILDGADVITEGVAPAQVYVGLKRGTYTLSLGNRTTYIEVR